MGLCVESGGVDVSEDVDLSGGAHYGVGLGGVEARWLVRYRLPRVCGEVWEDFPNNLGKIFPAMCFCSARRRSGACGAY